MDTPEKKLPLTNLERLGIPIIRLSDIPTEGKRHIGSGAYHTVYEVRANGKKFAFRANLHPDDPHYTQQSIDEVEGGYRLGRELPAINSELATSGSRVRLSCVVPAAVVVDEKGSYVGALAPIFDPTGMNEIYLDEMYSAGEGAGYQLMVDRWKELADIPTTGELNSSLKTHMATEDEELRLLEQKHKDWLSKVGNPRTLGEWQKIPPKSLEEKEQDRRRVLLDSCVKMQRIILKVLESGEPETVQEALLVVENDVKSAERKLDDMNLALDIGRSLGKLRERGYVVDIFGTGNVLGKAIKDETGKDIYLVHFYEVKRESKKPVSRDA